jgi:uncharacterized protein (TIGR00369 family)
MSDTVPFSELLGIEILSECNGIATVDLRRELHNRRGVAHGGALATLLDSAMARAARTLEDDLQLGGTVDLHIQFMSPGTGRLEAVGRVLHATRTLAFCQGEVRDAKNVLVATSSATISLRRKAAIAA